MFSFDPHTLHAALIGLASVVTSVGIAVAVARFGAPVPGFAIPWRRSLAVTVMALLWLVALVLPVLLPNPEGPLGAEAPLTWVDLFTVHILILGALAVWLSCGFLGLPPGTERSVGRRLAWEVGVLTPRSGRELLVGLLAGPVAMVAALGVTMMVAMVVLAVQGPEALPREISPMVQRIAALPVLLRLGVSVSAGVVEEIFFRGFLQKRIGIPASAALFVVAHAGYQAPLSLVGIGTLAVVFALLTRWRRNVWPAAVAHTFFDAVQLLLLVPVAVSQTA